MTCATRSQRFSIVHMTRLQGNNYKQDSLVIVLLLFLSPHSFWQYQPNFCSLQDIFLSCIMFLVQAKACSLLPRLSSAIQCFQHSQILIPFRQFLQLCNVPAVSQTLPFQTEFSQLYNVSDARQGIFPFTHVGFSHIYNVFSTNQILSFQTDFPQLHIVSGRGICRNNNPMTWTFK